MNEIKSELIIFTDLDGTLLGRIDYSYDKALPAVGYLRETNLPTIFCSAKTRKEQEFYRSELGIFHPFIVENGGAIVIPEGYFPFKFDYDRREGGYQIIELGMPYHEIRRIIERVRIDTKTNFKGFGDMSDEEVAAETGLDLESAHRAKQREYDETIKLAGDTHTIRNVLNAIKKAGLNYAPGGRYYDVMGQNDKGKATRILIDLFKEKLGRVKTAGIGDGLNDLPMLSAVDIPFLVQKPDGYWEDINISNLQRVQGIGPEGWKRAVLEIVKAGKI